MGNSKQYAMVPLDDQSLADTEGLKAKFMGEYYFCEPESCEGCDPEHSDVETDECEACSGSGTQIRKVVVPWAVQKDIFRDMVAGAASGGWFGMDMAGPNPDFSAQAPAPVCEDIDKKIDARLSRHLISIIWIAAAAAVVIKVFQ